MKFKNVIELYSGHTYYVICLLWVICWVSGRKNYRLLLEFWRWVMCRVKEHFRLHKKVLSVRKHIRTQSAGYAVLPADSMVDSPLRLMHFVHFGFRNNALITVWDNFRRLTSHVSVTTHDPIYLPPPPLPSPTSSLPGRKNLFQKSCVCHVLHATDWLVYAKSFPFLVVI